MALDTAEVFSRPASVPGAGVEDVPWHLQLFGPSDQDHKPLTSAVVRQKTMAYLSITKAAASTRLRTDAFSLDVPFPTGKGRGAKFKFEAGGVAVFVAEKEVVLSKT